ncbi:hypothetical protein Tco_1402607 [Tanacetum coccineum]
MSTEHSFQIKSLKPEHNCSRNYNLGSLVTYRWIAHHYAKQLIADPFIPTLKMKTGIREKFLINVSLGQWKQLTEPIVTVTPSSEPIASATHSTDKGKQVAEPQGKKKGSKRKAPASSEEAAGNQRIIFHKNRGRSERIFNQKIKKSGFGPNGEGSTLDKAFSLT